MSEEFLRTKRDSQAGGYLCITEDPKTSFLMATINYKHRSRDFEVEVHRSHLIIFVVVGMCFVDRKGLKCSLCWRVKEARI